MQVSKIASQTFTSQFFSQGKAQTTSQFSRMTAAIRNNRCDILSSISKNKNQLSAVDSAGKTLLFYAAYSKCQQPFLYLLRAGVPFLQSDTEKKNLLHILMYCGSIECLRNLTFFMKLTKLQKLNQIMLKSLEKQGFKRTDMKNGQLKFSVSDKRQSQFNRLQLEATKLLNGYLDQYFKEMSWLLEQVEQVHSRNPIHLGCLNKYQKCLPNLELLFDQFQNPNLILCNQILTNTNSVNSLLQQDLDPRMYDDTLKNLNNIVSDLSNQEAWNRFYTNTKIKIQSLLEKKDKDNQSALYIASKNGSTSMIIFLQKYSINPKTQYKQLIMKAADNNLARSHIIDLCDASKLSDVKPLNFLISCGEDVNRKKSIFGTFALIQSLKSYQKQDTLQPIIALIKSGADVNTQDTNGWTVLHHAASLGLKEVIELLLKTADETRLDISKVTNKRYHALHLAGMHEHPDIIELLISPKGKVHIDVADWDGCTTLIHAAKKGSLKVLKSLLKLKANLYCKDKLQMTALHHAAFSNHPHCIRELLNHDGDYDKLRQMRNSKGKLAKDLCTDSKSFENIFTAARMGNVNLIRKLTSEKIELKDRATIQKSRTPLILAVLAKSLPSVKFLVDTGADTYSEDKDEKSAAAYSEELLKQAKKNKKVEDIKILEQIKKLLE